MRLRNEIFAQVLDWLVQENKVEDQKDLAFKIGISQNTISRIMTGKVEPSDDTLRKLNATFGNIFNMQYLRGESTIMLIEDVAYYRAHPDELKRLFGEESKKDEIDQSSLINAALAAKDEIIAAKQEIINQLNHRLIEKDDLITELRARIVELQRLSSLTATSDPLRKYPFEIGVAESDERPRL